MSDNSEMVDAEETALADVNVIDDSCTVQYPLHRPPDDCCKSECIGPDVDVKVKLEYLQDEKQEPADETDRYGPHYAVKVRF